MTSTDTQRGTIGRRPLRRIKMIVPSALSAETLASFAEQIPARLRRDDVELTFVGTAASTTLTPGCPPSPFDLLMAAMFTLEAGARSEREGFDAVCVYAMAEPAVKELRTLLSIPVVGVGEASMHLAAQLGRRLSVLVMGEHYRSMVETAAQGAGLEDRLVSVRTIGGRGIASALFTHAEEAAIAGLEAEAVRAVEEDRADVLMLGSTTMHMFHAPLAARLDVPVVNPGIAAYQQCVSLLDQGLTHGRRAFPRPQEADLSLLKVLGACPPL